MAAVKRDIFVSVTFRIIVCLAVLGVAGLIFKVLAASRPQPTPSGAVNAAPRVMVMRAAPVPVRRQWNGFGTARAMDAADVPARVTATVIERPEHIRPGRAVTRGELLVRLDESDFARQVEIASQAIKNIDAQLQRLAVEEQSWTRRAELAAEDVRLARAQVERVQRAMTGDVANQRELDEAQQSLNTAQQAEVAAREQLDGIPPRQASLRAQRLAEDASLRLASQNVERSYIVSPIDGVVQAVDIELGENITAGQRVARVVNTSRIEAPLMIPASARALVQVGDPVELSSTGPLLRTWSGTVTRIAPEDDPATRTMVVFAEVSRGPAEPIPAPGEFVQGVVYGGQPQPRWVVPRRSIDTERVLYIQDGRVHSQHVDVDFAVAGEVPELGLPDRQWMVLKEPLPPQALVVVDGSRSLPEGSPAVPIVAGEEGARASNGRHRAPELTPEAGPAVPPSRESTP